MSGANRTLPLSSSSTEETPAKRQKVSGQPSDQTLSCEEINTRNEFIAAQRRDLVIDTAKQNRPANTTKTYRKAQREWTAFCQKYDFEDGGWVSADKLIWFTQEVILTQRVKKRGRKQQRDVQQKSEDMELVAEDKAIRRGYR
jgi:hypothetical protein